VEAVTAVGEQMDERICGGDGEQDRKIGAAQGMGMTA